jgi:hypothetical protein
VRRAGTRALDKYQLEEFTMNEDMRHSVDPWGRRVKLVLIGFSLIGGFFLIAEHRAHVVPYLPFLLLAACPLMHMFMHGGHGHGGHSDHDDDRRNSGDKPSAPPKGDSQHQHSGGKQ